MNPFIYYAPTKILFGADTENQVGAQVRAYGGTKVLIHYGGGSVVRSGLLDRVKASLDAEGIAHVELGGAAPNPRLGLVYEGIRLAKEEGVDFILGVGGGSAIDSAKAISYGVANEGDVWDFYCGKRKPEKFLPLGTVLTLAATGSEMSNSSVITREEGLHKRGYNNDLARPLFSVMNPELTRTLPDYQTASGCADIMMHTIERYFHSSTESLELTDSIAEVLVRTVMKNALILVDDPQNSKARAEVMWAGSVSHNGLTGCGAGMGDWTSHKMEHELGGMFDVTHGAGITALWGTWARYVMKDRPDRFEQFALNVMGVEPGETQMETALRGVEALEEFFRNIHLPVSIEELGVNPTDEEIRIMAEKCAAAMGGSGGAIRRLSKEDFETIYKKALKKALRK